MRITHHRLAAALVALAPLDARLAARQAPRLRVSPDSAVVAYGRRLALAATFVSAEGIAVAVRVARWASTCGTIDRGGRLTAPPAPAAPAREGAAPTVCRVRVTFTAPSGEPVVAYARVRLVESREAPEPPSPVRPAEVPPGRASVPEFPWPIPQPTALAAIPPRLLAADGAPGAQRLGDVAERLAAALRRAGADHAIYAIPRSAVPAGFVFVTRLERIDDAGVPFPPPDRFPEDATAAAVGHGFLDFVVSRFVARPGYFRILAIVVTSEPVVPGPERPALARVESLIHGGMAALPPEMADVRVVGLTPVVAIYEFARRGSRGVVNWRSSPSVHPLRHLVAAGIWSANDLGLDR